MKQDNSRSDWRIDEMEKMTYSLYVKSFNDVWFAIILDNARIVASSFSNKERGDVVAHVLKHLPARSAFAEIQPDEMMEDMLRALHRIFEGNPTEHEFPLDWDRLPSFTKNALRLTAMIPRGFVTTYGGIAAALGDKHAARAVGNAEARNPFAPIIPCHRVVDSTLRLHGYGHGLDVKRAFLERERVSFDGDRVSANCLWTPPVKTTE
jgi:methylated-DNA-[protein]-cysteine S-methyltransferase